MPDRRSMLGAAACGSALLLAAGDGLGAPSAQDSGQIERGRYLAIAADCNACHADPVSKKPFAGGAPIETPFGNVVAANITPDRDTGIGGWSEAQFEAAVRRGRRADGKRLYPAMPFTYYAKMSSQDSAALRAYLATVEPVRHAVESDQLPFPLSIRGIMAVWDALYFNDAPFAADASQSAQWNRGAYLVQGPGHCGACHTPKTVLGGDKTAATLQGYGIQGWFAPNLSNDSRTGLADWSEQDLVEYLAHGHNRFAAASGPMAEEVENSSSRMSDADLTAMAVYLKSQPGQAGAAVPLEASNPKMVAGAAIYEDLCSSCHRMDGTGVARLIPDLAGSAAVASAEPTTVIRVVLQGANSVATPAEPTAPAMPSFAWQLTDAEVAAVATFVRNSWSHATPAVGEERVRAARSALKAARAPSLE